MSETLSVKFEANEKLNEKIIQVLKPIIEPQFEELLVVPKQVTVPILQMLVMAPYKIFSEFQKFYNSQDKVILFISKDLFGEETEKQREAIIKIDRKEFAVFFITRTSRRIYKYVFSYEEGEKMFPANLSFYSTKDAKYIYLDNDNYYYQDLDTRILKTIFGAKVSLGKSTKIGNFIIVELTDYEKLFFWFNEQTNINGIDVRELSIKGVYYLYAENEVSFGESILPKGEYLLINENLVLQSGDGKAYPFRFLIPLMTNYA